MLKHSSIHSFIQVSWLEKYRMNITRKGRSAKFWKDFMAIVNFALTKFALTNIFLTYLRIRKFWSRRVAWWKEHLRKWLQDREDAFPRSSLKEYVVTRNNTWWTSINKHGPEWVHFPCHSTLQPEDRLPY